MQWLINYIQRGTNQKARRALKQSCLERDDQILKNCSFHSSSMLKGKFLMDDGGAGVVEIP